MKPAKTKPNHENSARKVGEKSRRPSSKTKTKVTHIFQLCLELSQTNIFGSFLYK